MRPKAEEFSQWDKGVLALQRALSAKPAGMLIIFSVFKFNKIYPSQKTERHLTQYFITTSVNVDVVDLFVIRLSCSIKLS